MGGERKKKRKKGPRRDPIRIFIPAMSQIDVITNRIIALIFPADEPNPLSFSDPSIPTIPHPRPARSERTRLVNLSTSFSSPYLGSRPSGIEWKPRSGAKYRNWVSPEITRIAAARGGSGGLLGAASGGQKKR